MALEAAFTYYVHNLEDEVAFSNLEYYLKETGMDIDKVTNREAYVRINVLMTC